MHACKTHVATWNMVNALAENLPKSSSFISPNKSVAACTYDVYARYANTSSLLHVWMLEATFNKRIIQQWTENISGNRTNL